MTKPLYAMSPTGNVGKISTLHAELADIRREVGELRQQVIAMNQKTLAEVEREEAVNSAVRACAVILDTCITRDDGLKKMRQTWPKAFA